MDNKEKVHKVLADILDIDIKLIDESTGPDNVESWDSFNALMLISEFEDVFGIKFTMQEVEHVNSVKDIIDVLTNKGVVFVD